MTTRTLEELYEARRRANLLPGYSQPWNEKTPQMQAEFALRELRQAAYTSSDDAYIFSNYTREAYDRVEDYVQELETAVREAYNVADFISHSALPEGKCFTLPDGQCWGNGCMHDVRKTS